MATKIKTLEQKMASLSPVRRRKVEARTAELMAEERARGLAGVADRTRVKARSKGKLPEADRG